MLSFRPQLGCHAILPNGTQIATRFQIGLCKHMQDIHDAVCDGCR